MSAFFKKYFWVVNLAAIAALAWTVASTLNAYTSSALFVVPGPPASGSGGDDGGALAMAGRMGEPGSAADLAARQVFDLTQHDDGDGEGGEPTEEEGEDGEESLADADELPETELPLDLLGTLVSPDPETSMATLNVEGENKLAWVGTEFMEGKAKVVAIAPRHVVVKESAGLRLVKLWTDKQAASAKGKGGRGGPPTPRMPPPTSKRDSTKQSDKANYKDHVRKTGPYSYEIDRSMLDEQLQDLSKLGTQARVVPNYRNGKYEGFKLVGVRPGSLYRAIGVRSGDVIKSINGSAIDSPNKALDLFEKLKNSSHIDLDIERRGQPKQFAYDIK